MKRSVLAGAVILVASGGLAWAQATAPGTAEQTSQGTAATTGGTDTTGTAANNSAGSTANNQGGNMSAQHMHMITRLRGDMEKAGFTHVRIMPESFLIRAKDRDGHPVMMVLNPDSMTEVTALGPEHSHKMNGENGDENSNQTPK